MLGSEDSGLGTPSPVQSGIVRIEVTFVTAMVNPPHSP
jgi:hypothetical protein